MMSARLSIASIAILALVAFLPPGSARASGVSVAVTGPSSVTPDTDFDVAIQITGAGSSFNAFDAIVGYDPAALTLVPLSPLSLQEGTLFTAACSNEFHRFRTGADRDTINLSMLCSSVSVTGPGQIYRLRFHASATPQVTTLRLLPGFRFFEDGLLVLPVTSEDLTLNIGTSVGVGESFGAGEMALRVTPNPARGLAHFLIETDVAGLAELRVCDITGRLVSREALGWLNPGVHACTWDGRASDGARQPAGVYRARFTVGGRATSTMLVLVR